MSDGCPNCSKGAMVKRTFLSPPQTWTELLVYVGLTALICLLISLPFIRAARDQGAAAQRGDGVKVENVKIP